MSADSRPVRKDVLRNRARLLKAADELVTEHGIDLSLNAVAHQAGVGVGTVYRHFADRDTLLAALLEKRVERVAAMMATYLDVDDPVQALRESVLAICELQSGDRGLWEVLASGKSNEYRELIRTRLVPIADELIERARRTGRMRADLSTTDLPIMLWIGGALNAYTGGISPQLWRRYLQIMLDGLTLEPVRQPLAVGPLTLEEVDQVMRAWTPGSARQP